MRRIISMLLILTMCFSTVTYAHADMSTEESTQIERIIIDGEEYLFSSRYTDEYSQVKAFKGGKQIADVVYYYNSQYITEKVSKQRFPVEQFGIINKNVDISESKGGINYHLDASQDRTFFLQGFAVAVEGAFFAALFPGMGIGIAISLVSAAIGLGLSVIYYHLDLYSGQDENYYYIKRVADFYGNVIYTKKIGDRWIGVQKKGIHYA